MSDLADAHVLALEWAVRNKKSTAFNLGNGQGFSVAEVIRAAEKVTGRKIATEISPRRPGDPPTLISDSSKAHQLLNWRPKYADLEQQIAHAWEWLRKANTTG